MQHIDFNKIYILSKYILFYFILFSETNCFFSVQPPIGNHILESQTTMY